MNIDALIESIKYGQPYTMDLAKYELVRKLYDRKSIPKKYWNFINENCYIKNYYNEELHNTSYGFRRLRKKILDGMVETHLDFPNRVTKYLNDI